MTTILKNIEGVQAYAMGDVPGDCCLEALARELEAMQGVLDGEIMCSMCSRTFFAADVSQRVDEYGAFGAMDDLAVKDAVAQEVLVNEALDVDDGEEIPPLGLGEGETQIVKRRVLRSLEEFGVEQLPDEFQVLGDLAPPDMPAIRRFKLAEDGPAENDLYLVIDPAVIVRARLARKPDQE